MRKLVVHMIGNAHLDPVWLWQWPAGLDEALQTCRTACDLLDEYPSLYVTRGEAWVHRMIELVDPALFERIRKHAATGRWACVNGWWIQPDCNLPLGESFRKHGEMSGRYFQDVVGVKVTVGYNVDSFGHNAMIPTFLREAGMDSYCFMRPGPHEMTLPANVFTWRSLAGDEVTAFRISTAYTAWDVPGMRKVLDDTIREANRDIGHTMCFYGVGDHGGGPTRQQIDWILANRDYGSGVELVLDCPRAFFDAVAASGVALPVVTGELQHHAIGCYSVMHHFKREMRRAEEMAVQAGRAVDAWPGFVDAHARHRVYEAWGRILFNQFHDVLAGTSIKPAYDDAMAELGFAETICKEVIVAATRRHALRHLGFPHQRLTLTNLSERDFSGFVEFEPWLGWQAGRPIRIVDERGGPVAAQRIVQDAAVGGFTRLLLKVNVPAMGDAAVEVRHDRDETGFERVDAVPGEMENAAVRCSYASKGVGSVMLQKTGFEYLASGGIRLECMRDDSDTWSHGLDRYDTMPTGVFEEIEPWTVFEQGHLRVTMVKRLAFGDSSLVWKVITHAEDPVVRMRLRLHWKGQFCVVKLVIPTVFGGAGRVDGCPGGRIERPLDGREYPIQSFTCLGSEMGGAALAVVSADVYAGDVSADGMIRLTLLRSPAYAHHDPAKLPTPNYFPITDQGIHEYEISLLPMKTMSMDEILDEVNRQTKPIWITETTKGMPGR